MQPEQILEFNKLLDALSTGKHTAKKIDLADFGISDAELKQLIDAIKINPEINEQIQSINLSGHNFNFSSIDGLTGLEELIINNKNGKRSTTLVLNNLPRLKKLQSNSCKLEYLSFLYITELQTIDLSVNRLDEIDLDDQVGLTHLNLRLNRFKNLNLSGLRYLESLDVSGNSIRKLYLGNSPLSQKFSFDGQYMSENSKKQIWARYNSTNREKMQYTGNLYEDGALERIQALKTTVRVEDISHLEECFVSLWSEIKNKLNILMWNAHCTYAYCQKAGIPADLASDFALNYFKAELRQRLRGMLQQFDSVAPLITESFIKTRVEPFIEKYYKNAQENLKRPKFTAALNRLLNVQQPSVLESVQEPELETTQESVLESAQESVEHVDLPEQSNLPKQSEPTPQPMPQGCLPLSCLPNIRPLTWLATGCKTAAQQSKKQIFAKLASRKKYSN